MFGAICYDTKTAEVMCEWIDLAPHGDHSQLHYFKDTAAVSAFLNRRPPQVQVVVDVPLNQAAYTVLASTYEQIGQAIATFTRPPDIEIAHRRTLLTFIAQEVIDLVVISYLATWPFHDGEMVRTTLLSLSTEILESANVLPDQDNTHQQLHKTMTLLERLNLQTLRQTLEGHHFFAAPLQATLFNNNGKTLELYHNPRFGTRKLSVDNGLFPMPLECLPSPQVEEYLAFLSSSI